MIGIRYPPGTSYLESARNNTLMEQALLRDFPDEISHIWSRVGEPDINTDAGTPETTDMFVTLKPRSEWARADSQVELVSSMEKLLVDFRGPDDLVHAADRDAPQRDADRRPRRPGAQAVWRATWTR